jgi:hypothetical protein
MANKKEVVLQAMREVLQQYEKKTHQNSVTTCPLCKLYYRVNDNIDIDCDGCPMHIFDKESLGCLHRLCRPVHAFDVFIHDEAPSYKAVMEFYREAIKAIEAMEASKVEKTKFRFLIKIDSQIAEKYGIK